MLAAVSVGTVSIVAPSRPPLLRRQHANADPASVRSTLLAGSPQSSCSHSGQRLLKFRNNHAWLVVGRSAHSKVLEQGILNFNVHLGIVSLLGHGMSSSTWLIHCRGWRETAQGQA